MRRLISFAGQSLGVFLLFFTLASAQTASLTAEQRTEKKTQLPFGNL